MKVWLGWRNFFGVQAYPFDLDHVEARDDTAAQVDFLRRQIPVDAAAVDLGCGHGRHMAGLTKSGHRVIGLDALANCVDRTAQRVGSKMLVQADMDCLPFRSQSVEVVYSMYSSIGYESAVTDFFRGVRRVLKPAGRMIIDVDNRHRVVAVHLDRFAGGIGLTFVAATSGHKRILSLALKRANVQGYLYKLPVMSPASLLAALADSKFEVLSLHGGYRGEEHSSSSKRTIVIACRA